MKKQVEVVEKPAEKPAENYHVSEADAPKPKPIEEKNIIYHVSK